MPPTLTQTRISAVHPLLAVEGGVLTIEGHFPLDAGAPPRVTIAQIDSHIVRASADALAVVVPTAAPGGRAAVRVEGAPGETPFVHIGEPIATGLHQVDNPVFGSDGSLYVTYSGSRGQQSPVSIFRVRPNGVREPYVTGVVNPTSMAFDAAGRLHVSSRFEGTVYRIDEDGASEPVASDLGVSCGLAFAPDGALFVGDRSGTIFRVQDGTAQALAALPPSVAAFHLAMGPDEALYVTAPTLACYDAVYRVHLDGRVETIFKEFGRPQGLAFDAHGDLHVVEALAGACGVYRLRGDAAPELVVAAPTLVGIAFGPDGVMAVASHTTAYKFSR